MLAPGARKAAYSDIQSFQYRLWRDSLRVVAGGESPKLSQNKALAQRTLPSVLPGAELVGLAGEHGECRGDVDRRRSNCVAGKDRVVRGEGGAQGRCGTGVDYQESAARGHGAA